MRVQFNIPSSALNGASYAAPNGYSYELFDPDFLVVHIGQTFDTAAASTPTGWRVSTSLLTQAVIDALEPGSEYTAQITVPLDESRTFMSNHPVEVEPDVQPLEDVCSIRDSVTVHPPTELAENGTFFGTYQLFEGNRLLSERDFSADGADALNIDLSDVSESLDPSTLLLEHGNDYADLRVFRVNPSILSALRDLRDFTDRLNREIRMDSLEFSDGDYLNWMRHGRDRFNSIPIPTDIDMTEAEGPIRSMWLACSQLDALRTRYLEEGLTQYDYSGAGSTLTVDVTQFLESQAANLETRINDEGLRLKNDMHNRALVHGPGKWHAGRAVTGATGLSWSPVTGRGHLLSTGRLIRRTRPR